MTSGGNSFNDFFLD